MDKQHTTDTALAGISPIGPFYTTSEVAKLLRVSQRAVQNWIKSGMLPALRFGTVLRIRHADLVAFGEVVPSREGVDVRENGVSRKT